MSSCQSFLFKCFKHVFHASFKAWLLEQIQRLKASYGIPELVDENGNKIPIIYLKNGNQHFGMGYIEDILSCNPLSPKLVIKPFYSSDGQVIYKKPVIVTEHFYPLNLITLKNVIKLTYSEGHLFHNPMLDIKTDDSPNFKDKAKQLLQGLKIHLPANFKP